MKHLFKSLSVIALGLAALQAEAKFKVVTTFYGYSGYRTKCCGRCRDGGIYHQTWCRNSRV